MFKLIEKNTWKRKPYFNHYFGQIRCTYSITVNIDISVVMSFKNKNRTKLYPLLIYVLTKAVNNHEEFRTAINDKGELGVWDTLLPCYTVFHEENETFSNIWTVWNDDLMTLKGIWKCLVEIMVSMQNLIRQPIPFPYLHCHGPRLLALIWIYLLTEVICCLFLLMESIFSKMTNILFRFPFRCIMPFVTGFMFQDLLMRSSKYAIVWAFDIRQS